MPLRFINERLHGVLDYLVDITLIGIAAVAWQQGLSAGAIALPLGVGAANTVYSLLTRYSRGAAPVIPFSVHLALDAVAGVALIAGLGLDAPAWHHGAMVLMGGGILGAVALTDPTVVDAEG